MNTLEASKTIGKTGLYSVRQLVAFADGDILKVQVRVIDVRSNFGRLDYLVEPVAGSGQRWVSSESVTLD